MVSHANEKRVLNELKQCLADTFINQIDRTFSSSVNCLAKEVKTLLEAESVDFYIRNDGENAFRLKSERESGEAMYLETLLFDDITPLALQQQVYTSDEIPIMQKEQSLPVYIIPGFHEGICSGLLCLVYNHDQTGQASEDLWCSVTNYTLTYLHKLYKYHHVLNEENKYELLYRVTSKFHSSIDMEGVLKEVIHTLQKIYPDLEYHLLLSHDYTSNSHLPIQELSYEADNYTKASIQAYLTGELQKEDRLIDRQSYLYAPLNGKQGVYGVLQVEAPNYLVFPKEDIEFIMLLASTAGNALENAQLYQQSKKHVTDLQLINETSHHLNSNLRLKEKITYMVEQIKSSFKGQEIGFFSYQSGHSKVHLTLEGSTPYFNREDAHSFVEDIRSRMEAEGEALFIGDLTIEEHGDEIDFRSVMAVPMSLHEQVEGVAVVVHKEPYFFSFESFKLLQSLVHHSALAFSNSMLQEELEKTVITDYLTKLFSRNYLDEQLEHHVQHHKPGAFLLIDLDNFKAINDTHGHQIGDDILVQVAGILKDNSPSHAIAARWGGEELALFLPRANTEEAALIAQLIRHKVAEQTKPSVTVSCGVSWWSQETSMSGKQIVSRADEAMYRAKTSGKNSIEWAVYG
ncbi:sensor domain-containing diguanylate cyclase [Thalassobacillus sp. CUG 92003]|uniref:sensor domain-containing diguanylate cyclase n=1 Tax=Thalassobacillus sp. CUG 92003 TaxID=2736641 RepID=UPI0015E7D75A|nr:diguanylate cyclase [Thalassobacillus sp. CUG 92003]